MGNRMIRSAVTVGGFSLVELMVSMALGLLIITGLMSVMFNSSGSQRDLSKAVQRVDAARYAMALLTDDIQHAGFYGEYYGFPEPAALPDPCGDTLAEVKTALGLPIQGYDAPTTASSPNTASSAWDCLPDGEHMPGTDVLVVRRASTATGTSGVGPFYLQTTYKDSPQVDTDPVKLTLTKTDYSVTPSVTVSAPIRRLHIAIYYVSPCFAPCSEGTDNIPTLKRIILEGANDWSDPIPLSRGVENLQIEYGMDRNNAGWAEDYVYDPTDPANPADPAPWRNVVALQVLMLVRDTEPSPGYIDKKSYTLNLAVADPDPLVVSPNDQYRRQMVSGAVRAINVSSRRELP